jgi:phage major head subunit gpT-like protein
MIINSANLDLATKGFKTIYTEAGLRAKSYVDRVAMTVPSGSASETYGWLGMIPALREWLGPRVVTNFSATAFTITNKLFESTVRIRRTDFEDDKLGLFKPAFELMGYRAKTHPDELVFSLLKAGFATPCFDGQFFFDTDHPVIGDDGTSVSTVSNMQAGSAPAWYLLDTNQPVRPIIWQERVPYEFQSMIDSSNPDVFVNDEYTYGVRARVNAGFGLWQLAFGSKAVLNAENYAAARSAMMNFRSDGGRILGVSPTVLVVPPELEAAALALVNTELGTGGISNPWKGTAELLVTPYVS